MTSLKEPDAKGVVETKKAVIKYNVLDEQYIDLSWIGTFTHGWSSSRGTRVYLTEQGGAVIRDSGGWVPQSHKPDSSGFLWLDDDFAVRHDEPAGALGPSKWLIQEKTAKDLQEHFSNHDSVQDVLDALPLHDPKQRELLWNDGSGDDEWIALFDPIALRKELKAVRRYGRAMGVDFRWV